MKGQEQGIEQYRVTQEPFYEEVSGEKGLLKIAAESKMPVMLKGPTGCGKTYLACALATQACRHGFSVRYFRTSRLLEALSIAHGDGRFQKLVQSLAKTDLLVLDDWGLEKMNLSQRNDMLEIMEDRHGARSTIITSQLPITQWHKAIGDATLADAILDRLLHGAHRLNLKGESLRKAKAQNTESVDPS
mgnify:CR=1 FL=1